MFESNVPNLYGSRWLQVSPKPEVVGPLAEECNHVSDVAIQREPYLLRSLAQIVPADGARKRLVLHSLHDRRRLEIEHALGRTHERRGGDESRHLVTRKQRVLEPRLTGDARILRMRQDCASDPLRVAAFLQDLHTAERVVLEVRPALVIEVVQDGHDG